MTGRPESTPPSWSGMYYQPTRRRRKAADIGCIVCDQPIDTKDQARCDECEAKALRRARRAAGLRPPRPNPKPTPGEWVDPDPWAGTEGTAGAAEDEAAVREIPYGLRPVAPD